MFNAATTYWQEFSVPFRFPVVFGRGLLDPSNRSLIEALALREPDKRHRALVAIDDGLAAARPDLVARVEAYAEAHADAMQLIAPPRVVPGGERIKQSFDTVEALLDDAHKLGLDRHSYLIAIGGGAMLDAVGFAAAIAHRGVRHVRLPSTVLSQNDSGVGVKNAINLHGVKNFMGSFAPPWAVLNDFDLLDSLERRDKISGVSEAVKVALIRDAAFFERLERDADQLAAFEATATEYMIQRCAELHMAQIGQGGDPFESGSARPLDFGHWAAHKLESLTNHAVRHGEAVAIGIALDARYSVLKGLLPRGQDERIWDLLKRLGFTLWHPALLAPAGDNRPALLRGLQEFQEHLGGRLSVTMLDRIGAGREVHEIDEALMIEAADWLKLSETG